MFAVVIQQECASLMSTIPTINAKSQGLGSTLKDIGTNYLNLILSSSGLALYRVIVEEVPRFPDLARQFYLAGPKRVSDLLTQRMLFFVAPGDLQLKGVGRLMSPSCLSACCGMMRNLNC
ncbi:TetR/AcrR family transcriptional regulator C-terminal domain-containing protein [Aquitalea sp.]|jgi:hypothetical protein|uniref:TetR/AcrR family transcriptional regulator C-terminal domain-containing protein n=1 Tax=Aquitalea sp. TaxID=1872623 RepID=UPI0025882D18|nr:TetR/AcrR family transcriptional regulator C-terminal domain-containing protein [Aquitalea sp.]